MVQERETPDNICLKKYLPFQAIFTRETVDDHLPPAGHGLVHEGRRVLVREQRLSVTSQKVSP